MAGNLLRNLFGAGSDRMSGSMQAFLECLGKVDQALQATQGPWFLDEYDHPSMIDFIYVSHVERMLASIAYWKGVDLRDPKWKFTGLTRWLEAFEKREAYLAFKSDYYTHVMDIPPQYGPGYFGGVVSDQSKFANAIRGTDNDAWTLPLSFDDPLQPLYHGPPLPLCVLQSEGLEADANGSYHSSDPATMERACRHMAAWKLSTNGANVAKFAARGGPSGSKNPRKTFGAPLADPYAASDETVATEVDKTLRSVCQALVDGSTDNLPQGNSPGVASSLAYLRDRIGVPRDLPLASARYLRAYLNAVINSAASN